MKKKYASEENPYHIYYDNYLQNNSSSTECTGLMPGPCAGREQWEAYRDVCNFAATPYHDKNPKEKPDE